MVQFSKVVCEWGKRKGTHLPVLSGTGVVEPFLCKRGSNDKVKRNNRHEQDDLQSQAAAPK